MRLNTYSLPAAIALGLTFGLVSPACAATILSDNFESGFGVFSPTGNVAVLNGYNYIGCCGTSGSATNMSNNFVSFGSGNQPSGIISSPIGLVTGTTYTLTFDYRSLGAGAETLYAVIDGVTYPFAASADDNLNNPYQSGLVTFVATGPTTTLRFYSSGLDNVDAIVDNVLLTGAAVPEPTSWATMLLGFGAIGIATRRKRAAALATA